jgi:hypothetical protein
MTALSTLVPVRVVGSAGGGAGAVDSVDGRTGVVTLGDRYVDVGGDTMTGNLGLGQASPTAKLHLAPATTPAGGIKFGADVDLYRDQPGRLRTDSSVIAIRTATNDAAGGVGVYSVYQSNYTASASAAAYPAAIMAVHYVTVAVGQAISTASHEGAVVSVAANGAGNASQIKALAASVSNSGTGTVTTATGIEVAGPTGAGPISTANGLIVRGQGRAGVTTAVGLAVDPVQGADVNNFGVIIGTATGRTLWIGSTSQPTTAAGGISFGSAMDTTLFRSAAGVLSTNGALALGTNPAQSGALRLANNQSIIGRNAANSSDIRIASVLATDFVEIGPTTGAVQLADGVNLRFGTGTGTQIGMASNHKLGFYGVVPTARQTGTPAAATDLTTTTTLVNDLRAKLIQLGLIL